MRLPWVNPELNLILKQGNNQRGNVVPAQGVHRDQFQTDLAATRTSWSKDET